MSYKDTKLFGIREVAIYPKPFTTINSRSECNPYINKPLPLFTAPMSSVVDEESAPIYAKNKINPIIPRNISFKKRLELMSKYMIAISLSEANNYFVKNATKLKRHKKFGILIDIANGHMKSMQDTIRNLKKIYKSKIVIMCGNIANPVTFRYLSEAGADYIRVGIGGGSGCLTASNTGIFYPMGSLILGCKKIQRQMMQSYKLNKSPRPAMIVADGGMKNYDYIIKALFLGADYVMCGRIFSQTWEAPGERWSKLKTDEDLKKNWHNIDKHEDFIFRPDLFDYKKIFYGMSTKKAQKEIAKANCIENCLFKTSEGVVKEIPISYTIEGWTENFIAYFTSAMSYTECRTLKDVKEFDEYRLMTSEAQKSYNR